MKKTVLTIAITVLGFFQIATAQTNNTSLAQEIENTVRETLQGLPKLNIEVITTENIDNVAILNAVADGLNENLNTALSTVLLAHQNETENLVSAVANGLQANMTTSIVNTINQSKISSEMAIDTSETMMVKNEIENTVAQALTNWL